MDTVIGIVTFRRPEALARLLAAIGAVQRSQPTRVLVVDNDPKGSAWPVVEAAGGEDLRVDYVCEPEPGIAAARNRAVRECAGAEFLAFIDDDEVPSPEWLEELLQAQRRFGADLVAGPVISHVEGGPAWLVSAGFFDRARRQTGPARFLASSANLLLHLPGMRRLDEPLFDLRFGLTGGSDTLLSLRVQRAGLQMAWADSAIVTEHVPAWRATPGWILRRAFRCGTAIARCETAVAYTRWRRAAARLTRAGKGGVYGVVAVGRLLIAAASGRAAILEALRRLTLALGMIAGSLGAEYVEYRRAENPSPDWPSRVERLRVSSGKATNR